MGYDAMNFKVGLAAALCSKARALSKREPIGFLYGHVAKEGEEIPNGWIKRTINGVDYVGMVLSDLPASPDETYKYQVIVARGDYFRAYTTSVELKFEVSPSGDNWLIWEKQDDGVYKGFRSFDASLTYNGSVVDAPEWKYMGHGTYLSHFNSLLWSNYNILDESGTLILEKSDQIPIYE
jgi:hypothetical protein